MPDKTAARFTEDRAGGAPQAAVEVLENAVPTPRPVPGPTRMVEEVEPDEAARLAWYRDLPVFPRMGKDAQGHGYRYTPLNQVLSAVLPVLRQAGYSVRFRTWSPTSGTVGVRCIVTHKAGWHECAELIANPVKMVGGRMNGIQATGAFVTYAERYTLLAVLGTTADVDTDAATPDAGDTRVADEQGRPIPDAVVGSQPSPWEANGDPGPGDDDCPF